MTKSGLLNILTFDWHEPYLCMLAETGHRFYVVEVEKGGVFGWQSFMRPVPPNVTLLTEADALERLYRGEFHLAICHNMRDLMTIQGAKVPKIKILHNKMSTEIALGENRLAIEDYRRAIQGFVARGDLSLVFISETKREDAGLDGTVIPPGIDVTDYGGYHGEQGRVLRVGNLMKERDIMMGFSLQAEILRDISSTLLGVNPTVPGSKTSESWDDLKAHFRSHRVFLNTTLPPREDGYNLAMLEAMATGMPVVSVTNPTSPIVDGTNGYISDDIPYLRERILGLLSDRDLAVELGQRGRETVAGEFPMSRFVSRWNDVFTRVADGGTVEVRRRGKHGEQDPAAGPQTSRKRVLLCYTAYPASTGHYLERSLRRKHDVVTCGPCMTPQIIEAWNLENMKEKLNHHDIHVPLPGLVDMSAVIETLETGWEPDLFLWVETGIGFPLQGLPALRCPKACYLIDTHLHLDDHIEWAAQFDVVFLAQKAYIPAFQRAGIRNVFWLPLACDPEFHGKAEVPKVHDIGFVGSIGPQNGRRARLLEDLSERFDLHLERCFLKDMARVFSGSRIIFNNAIKNDLNMRVFEALCSGSLLVTDRARGSGLEEFFRDREHLVVYEDDGLETTVEYYLKNENEQEAIAAAGRREVLARHTYDHRADEMITRVGSLVDSGAFKEPRGTYYWSERQDVIEQVPLEAKRVLDVGCAAGLMGKRLKERGAREVVGIERNPEIAREAEGNLDRVWTANVETFEPPWERGYFDAVVFGDVLEHLADPLSTLVRFKPYVNAKGSIIASIPNVRFWSVVQGLAEGDWTYQDAGILDRTHLRFFTLGEIRRLFSSADLDIVNVGAKLDPRINDLLGQSYPTRLDFGRMSVEVASEAEMTEFFVFQYIVTARPKPTPEHADTAEELEQKGCLLQAKERYLDRLEENPSDGATLLGLGRVLMHMEQWEEAASYLRQAVEAGEEGDALVLLGRSEMKLGVFSEALSHLEMAQGLDGHDPSQTQDILHLKGDCLVHLGEYDSGAACYQTLIDMNAGADEAWAGLGVIYVMKGDYPGAERHFRKALTVNPENDRACCGLGVALWHMGRKDGGFERFQKSLDINPENMTALDHLVRCSYENKRYEISEAYLRKYLERHPLDLNILFSLGGICYQRGDLDGVRKVIETIEMFQPDHDGAKELAGLISKKPGNTQERPPQEDRARQG